MQPDVSHLDFQPARTMLLAVAQSAFAGFCCALLAGCLIWWLSTHGPRAVRSQDVWARWRQQLLVWILALGGCLYGAIHVALIVARAGIDRDPYWFLYPAHFTQTVLVAAPVGYLAGLLLQILIALRQHRRG